MMFHYISRLSYLEVVYFLEIFFFSHSPSNQQVISHALTLITLPVLTVPEPLKMHICMQKYH